MLLSSCSKCDYCMFCSSWIVFHFKLSFFVNSVCLFFFSFHSLTRMLPVYHWVCFYLFTHTYLSVCMHGYMIMALWTKIMGVCAYLVVWPQSISQYRAPLFSVPSRSISFSSGNIIFASVCMYTGYIGACVCLSLYVCMCISWWVIVYPCDMVEHNMDRRIRLVFVIFFFI